MHTCPITVAPVSLMSPSQHHARILLIRKCSRSHSPNGCQTNSMPKFTHSITRRPTIINGPDVRLRCCGIGSTVPLVSVRPPIFHHETVVIDCEDTRCHC